MTLFDIYIVVILMVMFWEYKRPKTSLNRIQHVYFANILTYILGSFLFYGLNYIVSIEAIFSSQIITLTLPNGLKNGLMLIMQFLLIDLIYYTKHRLDHYFKPLWRLHLVHHSDLQVDVSTSFRHHPVEVISHYIIVMCVAWLCGVPNSLLVLYAFISSLVQPLHHANLAIPERLLDYLSFIVITPATHKVHHSSDKTFTNSNYGNLFPFWDRIFRTYQTAPELADFGLTYFRDKKEGNFSSLLTQPFRYSKK
ncbi:sterol desaturase family protein [Paraglaciecola sp. MB-3u-78]|uniref:sterol desaturase family protein n=1 Tax=Paraglaciecola sp. MB-3u-78 TaxID=2058332 RepID=UPI000C3416D0|nr:sterol desaturase family protein [Paraglaciecola sp. MB-3u-78]PKG96080.1 hypothetical protein CXF95_24290 [Paraglaciecola sp. MB-3u-78]